MLLVRNKPLYTKVSAFIMEKIKTKEFVGTLPSEDHLAKLLNVSKNTVREALAELTLQGIICKRHGSGNIIMESAMDTKYRIDTSLNFFNILEKSGYKTEMIHSYSKVEKIDLPFIPKDKYLIYNEIMCAGGVPACTTSIYIKASFFNGKFPPENLPKPDMFAFIEEYTGEIIAHSLVMFEADKTDEFLAKSFSLPVDTPILTWREIFYTFDDTPICYTRLYFHPNLFTPTMIRKGFSSDESGSAVKCTVIKDIHKVNMEELFDKPSNSEIKKRRDPL